MRKRYYFPLHLDGGNRGCEGIAKGTALILDANKSDLIGYCSNTELDERLGIGQVVTLQKTYIRTICDKIVFKIYCVFVKKEIKRRAYFLYQSYHKFLDTMQTGDIMLSTGGDMMCYGYNQAVSTVNYVSSKKLKSVLWGCSIGENNITPEKIEALKKFSLIYARESYTKKVLEKYGMTHIMVHPDPAFFVKEEDCDLPKCFSQSEVIGINISNYILGGFSLDSAFAKEVIKLLEYILEHTDMRILLIPHVLWKEQDDRVVSNLLKEHFNNERITILESEKLNYCQIRHVISKCMMFIGGRTHSVISAYSMCVPTIALGYSIKSVGIAHDLGLPGWAVVDSKNCKENGLVESFKSLIQNKDRMKSTLENYMRTFELNRDSIIRDIQKHISSL
jgi:colanic acid/amylovoran biosynthesis protein